ncbi:MAG: hypothetical protein HC896_15280 [Bacteroidales bacterium]|nr:hypothetical protein [Bacteroidales bacterium]
MKRTRAFAITLGVVAIVFFGLMFYANLQKAESERQKQLAEELRLEANQQKEMALVQKQIADSLRQMWESTASAEQQRRVLAEMLKELTEEEKDVALIAASESEKKSEQLLISKQQEEQQRKKVEEELIQTEHEKTEAEKASEKAYKKRILSISKSLAVKSQQNNDDKTLKALLAVNAYNLNLQYDGSQHNNDIYNALFASIFAFSPDIYSQYTGHTGGVRDVAFIPGQNDFISAGSDGKLLKWELLNPKSKPVTMAVHNFLNRCLAISPNGKLIACGGDAEIYVYANKSAAEPWCSKDIQAGFGLWNLPATAKA